MVQSIVAGCDPGLSGAIAFLDTITNRIVAVYDLPLTESPEGQRELDQAAFADILERHNPRLVVLEQVQGFGGVSSAFKLGASYGGIIVQVLASRFRLERVRPQVWQSTIFPMHLDRAAYDTKAASIYVASRAHPEADLKRGPKSRKLDHNRADAVCLAMFGRRVFTIRVDSPEPKGDRTRKAGK